MEISSILICFRAQLSLQRRQYLIQSDLFKSQKVCRDLDMAKEVTEPAEKWFWPDLPKDEETEEEEEEDIPGSEFEPHEKLYMLTTYFRKEYLYCLWCGHSFNDSDDIQQNCPGRNREDHDE